MADRDADGRFLPGHGVKSPGNPHAGQVARLRAALLAAVTPDDVREIIAMLVREAKAGNLIAVHELLDRCIGKPATYEQGELLLKLEEVEELIATRGNGNGRCS